MKEEDYIKIRLDHQIEWYDQKSIKHQKKYKLLRNLQLVLTAFIPLMVGYIPKYEILLLFVGVSGALAAIISGILSLNNHHEYWIEYRSICETLRHEKYMYLTNTGVYDSNKSFKNLVERVETIISKENVNWAQLNNK